MNVVDDLDPDVLRPRAEEARISALSVAVLLVLLAVAAGLRTWRLGELSFWYDEVVTIRLAESPTPAELIRRLLETDATRAPLHPLLLQGWIGLFGASETAARAFSVLCGVATVALIFWIGRSRFDVRTGLWAAHLAAVSPLLIYYSREARMYAWLVLLTCLCWGLLFSPRRADPTGSPVKMSAYALSLTALLYSHPLGILMAGTLAAGSLCFLHLSFRTWTRWLAVHLAPVVLAAPWLGRYFDHAPEFLTGRLPIRFLIGTPIGFLGGNFLVLAGLAGLICFGLIRRRGSTVPVAWAGPVCLTLWLVAPPTVLYAYSWIGSPIFGPARYTVFVAPAYLILVAQGLAVLPRLTSLTLGIGITLLAAASMASSVYAPGLKADWRALGEVIRKEIQTDPGTRIQVVVKSSDRMRNVEVETARYYLPQQCRVISWDDYQRNGSSSAREWLTYVAIGVKEGDPPSPPDDPSWEIDGHYPGLVVYWVHPPASRPPALDLDSAPAPVPAPAPAAPAGSGRD